MPGHSLRRSERLALRAAELAMQGGLAVACGLAALAWAVERLISESWWCLPLAALAIVCGLRAMFRLADAIRIHRRSQEELAWENRRLSDPVEF
jgi:hypothetical protein